MTKATDNEAFIREFQALHGLEVDGWAGSKTRQALTSCDDVSKKPEKPNISIPDSYWPMLSKIESNDRPYVKASTSSASGLYQFIRGTWIGEGGAWGPNMALAFGGLKPTEAEQLQRAKTFTEKNAKALQAAGIGLNRASLYAAHFLGVGTAIKAINGDVKKPVANYVSDAAVRANPSILGGGKTVGDFLTWLHKKCGDWAR